MMPFWEAQSDRRFSGVALTMLTAFFAAVFPYSSGLEIPRPGVQLFYSCAGPVYLDLMLARWRAPRAGIAAWLAALVVQTAALGAVRLKTGHWIWPPAPFLVGAALLGFGVAVGAAFLGEFWSGGTARQAYLFGALLLFFFWRMIAPDAIQGPVDALLLPEVMPVTGAIGGAAIAALGWFVYGRERAA